MSPEEKLRASLCWARSLGWKVTEMLRYSFSCFNRKANIKIYDSITLKDEKQVLRFSGSRSPLLDLHTHKRVEFSTLGLLLLSKPASVICLEKCLLIFFCSAPAFILDVATYSLRFLRCSELDLNAFFQISVKTNFLVFEFVRASR
jgi:hypothetical protein